MGALEKLVGRLEEARQSRLVSAGRRVFRWLVEAMVGPVEKFAQEGSEAEMAVGVQLESARPDARTQGVDARGCRSLAGRNECGGREDPPPPQLSSACVQSKTWQSTRKSSGTLSKDPLKRTTQ